MFKAAGFKVAISRRIDAWLKTHVAEVSPMANALYMAEGDLHRLAGSRDAIVLMIRAIREGYMVLKKLDIPVEPAKHKIFKWIPVSLLEARMSKALQSAQMADLVGHAYTAQNEMRELADEFQALARTASVPTPAMDRLYQYVHLDVGSLRDRNE